MTITINPNPAQTVAVDTTETFADFANKVFKLSKRPIRHGNGKPIELEPGSKNSVLLLRISELATPQQFEALFGIIMQGIIAATAQGIIPEGWLQGVSTPFDLLTPAIPEQYIDEEYEYKIILTGEMQYVVTRERIPEVEVEEEVVENVP